jgi:MoaA/NifB/PqqE/SkfB family radical SAM enzyme
VRVYLGMTVSALNAPLLRETAASVAARVPGFSPGELHLNLAQFSDHGYENLGLRERAAVFDGTGPWSEALRLSAPRDPKSLLQRAYLRRVPEFLATGRAGVRCQALSATCFMDPTGTVHPCSIHGRPLGSVRDAGFDLGRVWRAEATLQARRDLRDGRCPGCWSPCEAYPGLLGSALQLLAPAPQSMAATAPANARRTA